MRKLSRSCWDKPHRCPGWAGAGWKFPKQDYCDGGYITYGMSKETLASLPADVKYPRWFHFGQCNKCTVRVLPYWTRKLFPTYYWGMREIYPIFIRQRFDRMCYSIGWRLMGIPQIWENDEFRTRGWRWRLYHFGSWLTTI